MQAVFPAACAGCGAAAPGLCAGCLAEARPAPDLPAPPGVDRWVAPFAYDGAVREAIARLKYRNQRAVLVVLADALAGRLREGVPPGERAQAVVTWIPTTPARVRERGFDHAALLARAVGVRLGRPVRPLLVRAPGPAQTGRTAGERRRGPPLSALPSPPRTVIVIDDVATTGATMARASRVLAAQGCKKVIGATAARTALKQRRGVPDIVDR